MPAITTDIFIQRARAIHGDKYDYSKTEYVNQKTKVCIICPEHGEFWQAPFSHLRGSRCPVCAGVNLWNRETCFEEAKKYQTRKQFQTGSVGAYTRALKQGWMDDYTWFAKPVTGQHSWTYEACKKESLKFKDLSSFRLNSPTAYRKSQRNGWLDDFTWLEVKVIVTSEKKVYVPQNKVVWNRDTCFEEAKKYTTRKQFDRGSSIAYNKARKEGWLDDYTWFVNGHALEGARRQKWDYETCYEEARKYHSRTEFQQGKGTSVAYKTARKNGWFKDYTWFKDAPKPDGYWTYERCYDEAKKYEYYIDFRRECGSVCVIARRNGWINDYDWLIKKRKHWTYKECYKLAKRHQTRIEFKQACPSAYAASLQNEWIDEFTWFKEKLRFRYWTQERCYEEAKKYTSKKDFAQNSAGGYSAACKNGWIADYDWMVDARIALFTDKIDCVYSYYFPETHSIYIGRTIDKKGRDYAHIFMSERDAVARYAKEQDIPVPPMVILEDFLTLSEGLEKEDFWKTYYEDQGYNVLNKAATGVGRGSIGALGCGKWNYETCYEEAKKYKTRTEFKEGCGSAYSAANKRGWLKDYTWFEQLKTSSSYWTYEKCYEEAKKYTTRKDFYRNSEKAYRRAYANDWIKDYTWFIAPVREVYWNHDTCYQAALTCKSKAEYEKKYSHAMNLSRKNGWLEEYTWFKRPAASNTKWTYEKCKAEASKYSTRGELARFSRGAYDKSWKEGWLDEFFPLKPES